MLAEEGGAGEALLAGDAREVLAGVAGGEVVEELPEVAAVGPAAVEAGGGLRLALVPARAGAADLEAGSFVRGRGFGAEFVSL